MLEVIDSTNPNHYLKIWSNNDLLHVEARGFLSGEPLVISKSKLTLGTIFTLCGAEGVAIDNLPVIDGMPRGLAFIGI